MHPRQEGEFELVLGNRQLVSVLFIVIVLLGIFFAMGFLAGRSTCSVTVAAKGGTDSEPLTVDSSPRAVEQVSPPPAPETKKPEPKAAAKKAEPAAQPATPAEAPAKAAPPPKTQQPPVGVQQTPPAGTYLQAAATRLPDAQNLLALFQQEGLKGYITPSPKSPDIYRVVIGPLASNESIAAARDSLAKQGIKTPFVVKY